MDHSISAKRILVGISLNPEESKELILWAITILAHQNDDIVALHVLVGEGRIMKPELTSKSQSQLRQTKAFVISMLGEFASISQSKLVNLEAKVGFSSSIGKGLIEEANSISADFILLRSSKNKSKRTPQVTRYCFEHAPDYSTLIFLGKTVKPQKSSRSNSTQSKETVRFRSRWSYRTIHSDKADEVEGDSNNIEGDTFSFEDSSSGVESTSLDVKLKGGSNIRRQRLSPCKLISSFLGSPFRKRNCSFSNKEMGQPLLRCFSYEEIMNATNNFHPENMAGQGGYAEVYKGELCDGKSIAVKRLTKNNKDPKKEKEFLTELGIIGHVCHPNTATLVGCCIENGLYLIFNYLENGNLASVLHGKTCKSLEWQDRYKIVIGVARGLHYLHKCCKHRIIHRDIKASNVLLGRDYEPQITDFGLAKWLPNKWSHHAVIPIEGTFGYLAPEYFTHGLVDEKTDVYAFGVLLLEIVSGRRPVDSSKQNLLLWAKPLMESGEISKLADPKMKGKYDEEQLHRVVLAASYCVRQSSVWRPSMSEILELLTNGNDPEVEKSWKIPSFTSDELDDYSMVFGYEVPIDVLLEDYV